MEGNFMTLGSSNPSWCFCFSDDEGRRCHKEKAKVFMTVPLKATSAVQTDKLIKQTPVSSIETHQDWYITSSDVSRRV